MKMLEMIYRQSIERVVEDRYLRTITDLLDYNNVSYKLISSHYHPNIGQFWIVRIWSAGTIDPTKILIDRTLDDLRFSEYNKD